MRYTLFAKNIGIMNAVCGITPGSQTTVEVSCVKLYTDYTAQQDVLKKHCRKLYKDEPIQMVIERNSEIAHWCRLLKESIMFFGESMTSSEVVYCGPNAQLIFNSLLQHFECPLSTTRQMAAAERFALNDETGQCEVILFLKRANPKTRYLNVVPFATYKHEDERLFIGSTLKIVDILLNNACLQMYISAVLSLKQIIRGQFLQSQKQTRKLLLSLSCKVNKFMQSNSKPIAGVSDALEDRGVYLG